MDYMLLHDRIEVVEAVDVYWVNPDLSYVVFVESDGSGGVFCEGCYSADSWVP
jgi:hypothetical protein